MQQVFFKPSYIYKFSDGVLVLVNEDAVLKSLFHKIFSIPLKYENIVPNHYLNNPLD